MVSNDDDLARLRHVNNLLKEAIELVEQQIRQCELAKVQTGQDNDQDDATPASPPSV